jgi:hypothetical protein
MALCPSIVPLICSGIGSVIAVPAISRPWWYCRRGAVPAFLAGGIPVARIGLQTLQSSTTPVGVCLFSGAPLQILQSLLVGASAADPAVVAGRSRLSRCSPCNLSAMVVIAAGPAVDTDCCSCSAADPAVVAVSVASDAGLAV